MKYLSLYILCQLACLPLIALGIPVVGIILMLRGTGSPWPKWAWVWFNDENGYGPLVGLWGAFVWLALRNPVDNFKYLPIVFGKGRPLWYWSNGNWYAKAGWESNGTICGSAGAGKGY